MLLCTNVSVVESSKTYSKLVGWSMHSFEALIDELSMVVVSAE